MLHRALQKMYVGNHGIVPESRIATDYLPQLVGYAKDWIAELTQTQHTISITVALPK